MKPRPDAVVLTAPVAMNEPAAGNYLGISPREVRRLREEGYLPFRRLGVGKGSGPRGTGRIVYLREQLDQLARRWPQEGGDRFRELLGRRAGGPNPAQKENVG